MEVAALIMSIMALLMSMAVMIIFLAKNVFSSHVVQMVPVDSGFPTAKPVMDDGFEEFNMPSETDIALGEIKRRKV